MMPKDLSLSNDINYLEISQLIFSFFVIRNNHFSFLHYQINGVDMDSARHDQAVAMLTGLDRFVRLVVQRDVQVPVSPALTRNRWGDLGFVLKQ